MGEYKNFLLNLSGKEIVNIAKQFGVKQPTKKDKNMLAEEIISIKNNENFNSSIFYKLDGKCGAEKTSFESYNSYQYLAFLRIEHRNKNLIRIYLKNLKDLLDAKNEEDFMQKIKQIYNKL